MSLVLVCDESGAKGHADQLEKFSGEVGIMAGYLLAADRIVTVAHDLDAICLPFRRPGRKLHVTELGADAERLRTAVYNYLLKHQIPIVYEAIHVQGFHDFHATNPDARSQSLHTEIATGVFAKAVAYATETGAEHSIRVLTDRIDQTLLNGFFQAFDELISDDLVVEVQKRGHKDPAKRAKAWLVSQVTWPDELAASSFRVMGYSVESDSTDSGLTVAADVLAGDFAYFFQNRRGVNLAGPLSRAGVMAGHKLEALCQGITDAAGILGPCDTLYQHPIEATRSKVEELLNSPDGPAAIRAPLAELVRGRAYMIHLARKGAPLTADDNWHQAREELRIPAHIWL